MNHDEKRLAALKAARVLVQEVHDAIDDRPEMADDELKFSVDTGALLQQIDEALEVWVGDYYSIDSTKLVRVIPTWSP